MSKHNSRVTSSKVATLQKRVEAVLAKARPAWRDPPTDAERAQRFQDITERVHAAGGRGAALLERVEARLEADDGDMWESLWLAVILRFPDLYDEVEATLDGNLTLDDYRPKIRRLIEQERRAHG